MSKEKPAGDFRALSEFRYQIRRFLAFSKKVALAAKVDPQQHQLMLAVRGLPPGMKPTIRVLSERLQIRHHSTVELVDRSVRRGLLERQRDGADRRLVAVHLTAKGEKILNELALHHSNELRAAGPELVRVLKRIIADSRNSGGRESSSARRR
ncbi:MAG TPA: helix-turn-helix domain-containing protein [Terriglobales bacterium]|nr:helix-turn-helix domain-containing protein [Terriglobales bacterium]